MFKPAMKKYTRKLSDSYYYVGFELVEPLDKTPLPLQFVNVWVPGVDEIPLSISNYNGNEITVLYKIRGEGTRALTEKTGFFGIKGPLGKGLDLNGYSRILFVAGGIGIAPLPYLVEYAHSNNVIVDVAWGVRESSMLFDIGELTDKHGRIYYATEDCKIGYCGMVVDLLRELLKRKEWDLVIGAGPVKMLYEIHNIARKENIEAYVSIETIVKCGIGACGSCSVKPYPKLLCIDGPVFKSIDIELFLRQSIGLNTVTAYDMIPTK